MVPVVDSDGKVLMYVVPDEKEVIGVVLTLSSVKLWSNINVFCFFFCLQGH